MPFIGMIGNFLINLFLGWVGILKPLKTEVIVNETQPALKPSMPSVFDDLGIGVFTAK